MKSCMLVAATLGLLVATAWGDAAPKLPKEDKDDLKKLQGDWTFTAWETGGRALAKEALETAKWTVKGDKYTFEMGGVEEEGTIKFDSAKKPATIDLAITSGNDAGKNQVGIVRIDGDTVTFCFARPGAEDRPTEFKTTADDNHILVTVKRVKKDD
ncbi:MAG TPA: TIGR03067 domain-containing protein [Gemmataceae bacterium]|nr:TIGR03067 domain-containing protein [Gemmataceae bacterium]